MTSLRCNVLGKTGLKTAQDSAKHSKKQVMRAVFALLHPFGVAGEGVAHVVTHVGELRELGGATTGAQPARGL